MLLQNSSGKFKGVASDKLKIAEVHAAVGLQGVRLIPGTAGKTTVKMAEVPTAQGLRIAGEFMSGDGGTLTLSDF